MYHSFCHSEFWTNFSVILELSLHCGHTSLFSLQCLLLFLSIIHEIKCHLHYMFTYNSIVRDQHRRRTRWTEKLCLENRRETSTQCGM